MKKNVLISVGIPVYNESANIKKLLASILSQIQEGFVLYEVIVISDASTDSTDRLVSDIKNIKIRFVRLGQRQGKSYCLNYIFQKFQGDVLFLLDGDIQVKEKTLFTKIIKENNFQKAGLVGINSTPLKPTNAFQNIMYAGARATSELSMRLNNGANYLGFKGCFLAIEGALAKRINMASVIVNNDSYIYFKAKELGYSPKFFKDAVVYYRLPGTFKDHLKQTERFKNSKEEMQKYFNADLSKEYSVSYSTYIVVIIKNILADPYYFLCYLFLKTLTLVKRKQDTGYIWNIALSTKK